MSRIRDRLARHLGTILVLKFLALWAIWFFFFSPAHRPVIGTGAVEQQFFTAPPTSTPESRHGT